MGDSMLIPKKMTSNTGVKDEMTVRSPWAADGNFTRSRFIVRRLRQMRKKVKSMHDEVPMPAGKLSIYTPGAAIEGTDSAASYESLIAYPASTRIKEPEFKFCKSQLDHYTNSAKPDVEVISRRNLERQRAVELAMDEPEYAEPLQPNTYTLTRSRARRSVEMEDITEPPMEPQTEPYTNQQTEDHKANTSRQTESPLREHYSPNDGSPKRSAKLEQKARCSKETETTQQQESYMLTRRWTGTFMETESEYFNATHDDIYDDDDISFSSASSQEQNEDDSDSNLLEAIEKSLPKEYSLKRDLRCLHSTTMYRTVARLNQPHIPARRLQSLRRIPSKKMASVEIEQELLRLAVEQMVQATQVEQSKRALEVSLTNRANLNEHIEAEKTLLLATIRHTTVHEEIEKWLRLQRNHDVLPDDRSGSAVVKEVTIIIDNIAIWSSYYFVLVAVESDNVKGSETVRATPRGNIHFQTPLYFSNLRANFIITFYLYGLTVKNPKLKFFHRSAERLHFLHRPAKTKWRNSLVQGIEHNFQLIGITEVKSSHFNNSNHLLLTTMIPLLAESLVVRMTSSLHLDASHSGFLNIRYLVRDENRLSLWSRYWVRLSGVHMLGWNYPSQATLEEPSHEIKLSECVSEEVRPVSQFRCVRPNTFSLELRKEMVERTALLSADSLDEMQLWCHHINNVLKTIRTWHC